MTHDDDDDFLDIPAPPRRPGRPPKSQAPQNPAKDGVIKGRQSKLKKKKTKTKKFKDPSEVHKAGKETFGYQEKLAIYEGVSISMLSQIFGKDNRTVTRMLATLPPCGVRAGSAIYDLAEAARLLVAPVIEEDKLEEYIKGLRPEMLPPRLSKEFWSAQRAKQEYEVTADLLWKTHEISELLAEVFKTFKTTVTLFVENIESNTKVTDEQRKVLERLCDGLLIDTHTNLIEGFRNHGPESTKASMRIAQESPIEGGEFDS